MSERKLSPRRRNLAVLTAAGIIAGIGFIIFGLTYVIPPVQVAHDQVVVDHNHAKLAIIVNGVNFALPSGIGIEDQFYNDHSLDSYGIAGFAPIHTHDTSGVLHIEMNQQRDFTLGELSSIWGENPIRQAQSNLLITSDKVGQISDWQNHVIQDGENITVVVS